MAECEEPPATPPNTSNPDPPESTCRSSSRVRPLSCRPGYIATPRDSRRTLAPNANLAPKPKQKTQQTITRPESHDNVEVHGANRQIKQVASRTGQEIVVDVDQDSEEEHEHHRASQPKDKLKDKDGFDHPKLYFHPMGKGPGQEEGSVSYCCRWCPKKYKILGHSSHNLKTHRDGANNNGSMRTACPGREKAIAAGGHFPLTAAEQVKASTKVQKAGKGNLIAYTYQGRFDNDTLNKLVVIWLVCHCLAWYWVEDFFLRLCFDYCLINSKLYSRVWATSRAHQLYLEQRSQTVICFTGFRFHDIACVGCVDEQS
ncbi:hypothetical protein PGTUg99_023428 [Puccinia graminis f. sp. tritici]|uniref:BED-type domain-containing protein n=1 Tax=Puccinia graminis f. sp. tritici TaxID=56615 RepID=A0A5B0RAE8_PUCGR|nr:hypothetical protein PGTUg99_023428 [Puccinia graminis f. sp. tritici]